MSSDRAPKSARLAGDEASSGRTIVWFRNDLRLHDHEVLASAAKDPSREIVPVYCFDPRHFGSLRQTGLKKTAVFRARFLLESVQVGAHVHVCVRGCELYIGCMQSLYVWHVGPEGIAQGDRVGPRCILRQA